MVAVNSVSLRVARGELRGVIGPNGAGKSTLFHLITGHLKADSGRIRLDGQEVGGLAPPARARLGVAIAFQAVRLFRGMSVMENVMVGAQTWTSSGFWDAALRLPRHRREEGVIRKAALEALERVGMLPYVNATAELLPVGRQRAVQVARALCSRPRLLLLDEPASGLRAGERAALSDLFRQLHGEGLTMLLVEHDVGFVAGLAGSVTVVERGRVIAEDTPDEVRRDPRVIAAYLGQAEASA